MSNQEYENYLKIWNMIGLLSRVSRCAITSKLLVKSEGFQDLEKEMNKSMFQKRKG